jgi:hypothetical protein
VTPSFPKPRPRLVDRIAYKRDREAQARAFRVAVWLRDGGICQYCERHVKHSIKVDTDPEFEIVETPPARELFPVFLAVKELWKWSYAQEAAYRARREAVA